VSSGTKESLPAKLSSDVQTLIAKEDQVVADLKSLQKLAKTATVASIAAKLKADEGAERSAEEAVSSDLSPAAKHVVATPPPTTSAVGVTLLTLSGSGAASTQQFTVPSAAKGWHVNWTYDCSDFGSQGNFDYSVNSGTNLNFDDTGPNQLGSGGSGVEHYYDTGTFNLQVDSECNWTVTAVSGP
jgi:hypothetical protein